jgi:hypothetical protein
MIDKPTWEEVRDDEPIYSPEEGDGEPTMIDRIPDPLMAVICASILLLPVAAVIAAFARVWP